MTLTPLNDDQANKIRVLVVDDEPDLRSTLRVVLSYLGVQVVGEAGDGVEALVRFRELTPNVVIMDIRMPEMDGLTCLTELLKIDPDVVVLLMTGHDDGAMLSQAIAGGARGFLRKPLVMDQLHRDIITNFRIYLAKERGVELEQDYYRYVVQPGFRPSDIAGQVGESGAAAGPGAAGGRARPPAVSSAGVVAMEREIAKARAELATMRREAEALRTRMTGVAMKLIETIGQLTRK